MNRSTRSLLLELARVLLSLALLLSGLLKAIDPVGVANKVIEYQTNIFGVSSPWLLQGSTGIAFVLVTIEFILGAFLLMGIYRRLASRLTFGLLLFMTVLTGYIYAMGMVIDCGCFGDAIHLSPLETFAKNIVLLLLAYYVMRHARSMKHLYSRRERWIPAILAIVGIVVFASDNYRHLPYIDFLPYKVGYNLRERIAKADATMQADLLESTLYIYIKGDERRGFRANELPDSTWTYVEMQQPQALATGTSEYSFVLLTPEGTEVTAEILGNDRGVFLFFSPSWLEASQANVDAVNELYRYAEAHGYAFYGVSPSHSEAEAEWRYQTGASYPSLFMDATTIKTIIRSNPGLVVMRGGVILDKVAVHDLPSVEEIETYVDQRLNKGVSTEPAFDRLILLLIWGVLVLYGLVRRVLRRLRATRYINTKPQEI